jgi:predicted Zn finger-like uncharacterized protein
MADHIIQCPQCQRQVRVPDTMFGRLVKCPLCGMTFTVAAANAPAPAEPPAVEAVAPGPPQPDVPAVPPRPDAAGYRPAEEAVGEAPDAYAAAAALVRPAAICLLLVGALGLTVNLFVVARNVLGGREHHNAEAQQAAEMVGKLFGPQMAAQATPSWEATLTVQSVLVLISFLVTLGALRMLQLRGYVLAVIASVLAMVNCGQLCCVLGLPVGIWSLIVLARADVRAAFE